MTTDLIEPFDLDTLLIEHDIALPLGFDQLELLQIRLTSVERCILFTFDSP